MTGRVTFQFDHLPPTSDNIELEEPRTSSSIEASVLKAIRNWFRRRTFREGKIVSRLIAKDVRRDVMVESADRIAEGIIIARVRTTNILYVTKGLTEQEEFSPPQEVRINDAWHWSGQSWGGLTDGTSIVDHLRDEKSSG